MLVKDQHPDLGFSLYGMLIHILELHSGVIVVYRARVIFIGFLFLSGSALAQSVSFKDNTQSLRRASSNTISIQKNRAAPYVRSFYAKQAISIGAGSAKHRSEKFLDYYAASFGASLSKANFAVNKTVDNDGIGMSHVHYQQTVKGVPVTGSYMIVHLKPEGVSAASSSVLTDGVSHINVSPAVSAQYAKTHAKALMARIYTGRPTILSEPHLEIYNQNLLDGAPGDGQSRLAWYMEAKGVAIREAIWVDAMSGKAFKQFSKIADARDRFTYDSAGSGAQQVSLVRTEAQPATGDTDTDNAHDFIGDSYDYYFDEHGRDSYDNQGAALISNVNYCEGGSCPYGNAFWDGDEMTYGAGFTIDDVVAHELSHGVIEFSANLIYQNQSGALNESFADIFGETVDLINGAGTDTEAVRWDLGEEIGAIRNLYRPSLHGDPEKVSDQSYVCGTQDQGGVHSNSGVPNHAFALMVDGGTYNNKTVSPIGLVKAGKIQYRALSSYLGPSSTLLDNYNALNTSCSDLIGDFGISATDCTAVLNAVDAVEMNVVPCFTPPAPPIAECTDGTERSDYFSDDFEVINSSNWTTNLLTSRNTWTACVGTPNIYCDSAPQSGTYSLLGEDIGSISDSVVTLASGVDVVENSFFRFDHKYDLESGFDGGVIEYSIDDGSNWLDAESLMTGRAYDGVLSNDFENPLGGRAAFSGTQSDYTTTQLDLSSLVGETAKFRFRVGTDSSEAATGWHVDDVEVFQCVGSGGPSTSSCEYYSIKLANGRLATFCL
ncbi:MAG: bacillolysin [Arenicella sp.]